MFRSIKKLKIKKYIAFSTKCKPSATHFVNCNLWLFYHVGQKRGAFWREAFIKFLVEKKFCNSTFLYKTTVKEPKTIFRLFLQRSQ